MKELSIHYIYYLCARFEKVILNGIRAKRYNRALRFLKALSFLHYKFYLSYKHDFIENQIKALSHYISNSLILSNVNEKSIAIIDEINSDYIGLMTQYLAPFIQNDYRILYIYEHKEHHEAVRDHLMRTLVEYDKAVIKEMPSNIPLFTLAQWIYDEVCAFGSHNVLMNFGEWAIEKCVACCALPKEYIRYHINACDHTFWAGVCSVDFSFEFRPYGANLSNTERGLMKNQIVYLPFYPIVNEVPFAGFPKECSGKFIFLTGGSTYKIVDKDNTFFSLCKDVLENCPNSVILYAGVNSGDVLSNSVKKFGLQGRFIILGYRNDILEVFRHCDAYINTYPLGGGLMCQFAAHCSKPIINFKNHSIEECVGQKSNCKFTYNTKIDFVTEAVKLYTDASYRQVKGNELHRAVISKDEFDLALISFIQSRKRIFEVKWEDHFVPMQLNIEDAVSYRNEAKFIFYYQLFKLLAFDSIWIMPRNVFSFCATSIKMKMKKFLN